MRMMLRLYLLISIILVGGLFAAASGNSSSGWLAPIDKLQQSLLGQPTLYIAHAGGGYQGLSYTNSLEALEHSYEVGFMRTTDGSIVCIHDWRNGALTYNEFIQRRHDPSNPLMKLDNCDLDSLGQFLTKHLDATLILDSKEKDGPAVFREITDRLTKANGISIKRIIPQAYSLAETKIYKGAGYPNIIYTLYKQRGTSDAAEACRLTGVAITLPVEWILTNRLHINEDPNSNPLSVLGKDCPVFVHPVGKVEEFAAAVKRAPQIRGIYTSRLQPVEARK